MGNSGISITGWTVASPALAAAKSAAKERAAVEGAKEAGAPATAGVAETGAGASGTAMGVGSDMLMGFNLFYYFIASCCVKDVTLDDRLGRWFHWIEAEEAVELVVPRVLHCLD